MLPADCTIVIRCWSLDFESEWGFRWRRAYLRARDCGGRTGCGGLVWLSQWRDCCSGPALRLPASCKNKTTQLVSLKGADACVPVIDPAGGKAYEESGDF